MSPLRPRHVVVVALSILISIGLIGSLSYRSNFDWNWLSNAHQQDLNGWKFDPAKHSRHYGLSPSQCDAAFPGLWKELNHNRDHHSIAGKVQLKDVGISWSRQGTVRAMIHDHQLYILEVKGCTRSDFRERSNAILHSIHRSLVAYTGFIPNIEFSFSVEDIPNDEENFASTTWSLTKRSDNNHLWLMPDFGYWGWANDLIGSYEQVLDQTHEDERAFLEKDKRAFWRGAILNDQRKNLLDAAKDKPWSDIDKIVWGDDPNGKIIPMHEHCRYMFVVHTEGRSYSGRLKYLLNCHSVVIIPEPLTWLEYFHHLLIPSGPDQNFVQVKADFSDLAEKMDYYLAHPKEAERIADNSVKTFRDQYLTPAAQACYWRKLFEAWRESSFEPEMYRPGEGKRWRGLPFEAYILRTAEDRRLD